jgi:hypothetical protein
MEVTVNVQAFEELKRVLSGVPERQLDMTNWNSCACAHAIRDGWFRSQGFTDCNDFGRAAAFFQISRGEAEAVFSGRRGRDLTPAEVIEGIDRFLVMSTTRHEDEEAQNARRQAVIDGLLAKANKAAQAARRVATALVAVFF